MTRDAAALFNLFRGEGVEGVKELDHEGAGSLAVAPAFSPAIPKKASPVAAAVTGSVSTARKAPMIAVAEHPVPVTVGMSLCPLAIVTTLSPSVTRSTGPVTARVVCKDAGQLPGGDLGVLHRMDRIDALASGLADRPKRGSRRRCRGRR